MRHGWDWNLMTAVVTRISLLSHGWWCIIFASDLQFSHQDGVFLDECTQITAAGLFQNQIMSIKSGKSWLRLESIDSSGHLDLTFESWVGTVTIEVAPPLFTPRCSVIGWMHTIHSSWTVLISYYEYNEWWDMVEIGIYWLQWSLEPSFWVMGRDNFNLRSPLCTPRLCVFG